MAEFRMKTDAETRWLGIQHHVCFHVIKKANVRVWMCQKIQAHLLPVDAFVHLFYIYMSVVVNWDVLHCSLFTFMLKVCNQPCSKVKRRKLKEGEGNPSLLLSLEGANRCKCLHTLTHKHVGVHAHTHATEWESHIVLATGYNWF